MVNAFGTLPDQAHLHVDLARHLVERAGTDRPRLVFILGAGSLLTGEDRHLFVEDLRKAPDAQALFTPGEATEPMLGGDELLVASDGQSHTTSGTMAAALLDEIEYPTHHNTRFTVGDT